MKSEYAFLHYSRQELPCHTPGCFTPLWCQPEPTVHLTTNKLAIKTVARSCRLISRLISSGSCHRSVSPDIHKTQDHPLNILDSSRSLAEGGEASFPVAYGARSWIAPAVLLSPPQPDITLWGCPPHSLLLRPGTWHLSEGTEPPILFHSSPVGYHRSVPVEWLLPCPYLNSLWFVVNTQEPSPWLIPNHCILRLVVTQNMYFRNHSGF